MPRGLAEIAGERRERIEQLILDAERAEGDGDWEAATNLRAQALCEHFGLRVVRGDDAEPS